MLPREVNNVLRLAIPRRPELRWRNPEISPETHAAIMKTLHPYQGFCYVATEVFCWIVDEARPFKRGDRHHYWAQIGDTIYDPTFDQFDYTYPYSEGKRTQFKGFSKRARELYSECCLLDSRLRPLS